MQFVKKFHDGMRASVQYDGMRASVQYDGRRASVQYDGMRASVQYDGMISSEFNVESGALYMECIVIFVSGV